MKKLEFPSNKIEKHKNNVNTDKNSQYKSKKSMENTGTVLFVLLKLLKNTNTHKNYQQNPKNQSKILGHYNSYFSYPSKIREKSRIFIK